MNKIIVLVLSLVLFSCNKEEEIKDKFAYVVTGELLQDFEFKKELDDKLDKELTPQKLVVEKLQKELQGKYQEVKRLEGQKKDEGILSFREVETQFNKEAEAFQLKKEEKSVEYNEQLITRLNEYIKKYGKENGYRFIFGTTSEGNIMYADSSDNITEEMTLYINEEYNR